MINFKSPHFLRALDIALNGKHSLLIVTSDVDFVTKYLLEKFKNPNPIALNRKHIYIEKPCPCGNFNNTNRMCNCRSKEIKEWQAYFPQTDMAIVITDFPFEYLEFDKSKIDREGLNFLKTAYSTKGMLPSELEATLKVAKTISEIDKSNNIKAMHIAEALQYVLAKEFYL